MLTALTNLQQNAFQHPMAVPLFPNQIYGAAPPFGNIPNLNSTAGTGASSSDVGGQPPSRSQQVYLYLLLPSTMEPPSYRPPSRYRQMPTALGRPGTRKQAPASTDIYRLRWEPVSRLRLRTHILRQIPRGYTIITGSCHIFGLSTRAAMISA